MDTDTVVPLRRLAGEFGMDRSHLRKYVISLGIDFTRIRTEESRGQATLAVTGTDAAKIRKARADAGFGPLETKDTASKTGEGRFYVVHLDPDLARVKLGHSNSIDERLRDYRCTNPKAQVAGSWPCRASWERAAIAAITNTEGVSLVGGEVYAAENTRDLCDRADTFFGMLPVMVGEAMK